MIYPAYSENALSLSRSYDRAAMLCESGCWYFRDLKDSDPKDFGTFENEDDPAWVNHHLEMLNQSLAGMRRAVSCLIAEETKTFCNVELDEKGYVIVPDAIRELLPDFGECTWIKLGWPVDKAYLTAKIAEASEGRKAIAWGEEVFFFPSDMPDNFIEIWWRRLYGGPDANEEMYPLYLEINEAYGWDCIGIER